MLVKQPADDKPLRVLGRLLNIIGKRVDVCKRGGHRFISLLYISSYVFTSTVAINGRLLTELLRDLAGKSDSVVCLIRTVAPSCLPRFKLHKEFLERLRDYCYIVVYDMEREFLNHAKFIVWFHVCFNEMIVYKTIYYGSTNFTWRGLAKDSSGRGNFEEFHYMMPRVYSLHFLPKGTAKSLDFYLGQIEQLLRIPYNMYTNRGYVSTAVKNHLNLLRETANKIKSIVSGTTVLDLYRAFVNGHTMYLSILALLYQLPGRKLTEKIYLSLTEALEPLHPLMLETMSLPQADMKVYKKEVEKVIKEIIEKYYSKNQLSRELRDVLDALENARKGLQSYLNYLLRENDIRSFVYKHGDSKERELIRRVERLSNIFETFEEIRKLLSKGPSA